MEPRWLILVVLVGALGLGAVAAAQARLRRSSRPASAPDPGEAATTGARVETVDPVTGLAAGHRLRQQIGQRLLDRSHNRGCGVLVCAPDLIDALTRGRGQGAAETVLAALAERVAPLAREEDIIVRGTGFQVVFVTTQVPAERDLQRLADRLIEAAAGPVELADGEPHDLTISVGIGATFDADPPADALLGDAILARHRAEQAGGGRAHRCTAADRHEAAAHYELQRDLKGARARGEFEVLHQPIVELETGAVDWLEALVRWRHPRRGLLHPASFLAETIELGLGLDVADRVVAEACTRAAGWTVAAGRPVRVSVNIDAATLAEPALVEIVDRHRRAWNLDRGQLLIEVAEATLDRADQRGWATIERLAGLGVDLVVDQARPGHEASWPVAPVARKVDWRLLGPGTGPGGGVDDPSRVVVTGVERADQVDTIGSAGLERAQGFWLHRPVPADQIEVILTTGVTPSAQASTARP